MWLPNRQDRHWASFKVMTMLLIAVAYTLNSIFSLYWDCISMFGIILTHYRWSLYYKLEQENSYLLLVGPIPGTSVYHM